LCNNIFVRLQKKYLPIILFTVVVPVLLGLDFLSKYLTDGRYLVVIPRVLSFSSHHNTGIAFSWFAGAGLWLILVTAILCVGSIVAWWFFARRSVFASVAFALFVAGGFGNLYDRIFHGHVRDFLTLTFFPQFPIFNLADVFLTVGTILISVYFIRESFRKEKGEFS